MRNQRSAVSPSISLRALSPSKGCQLSAGTEVRAITLHQPWATLMAKGLKKIETRSWYTAYRGLLVIHAAAYIEKYDLGYIKADLKYRLRLELEDLPTRCMLGICELSDCEMILLDNSPARPEYDYGNYKPGRYMWKTKNMCELRQPIPARGYQRLWRPTEEQLVAIREQLG